MATKLAETILALITDKIEFVSAEAEAIVDGITTAALSLDAAADEFEKLAGEDVDQEEIAVALVNLADLFDDVNLSPAQLDKLNGVVNGLLKSGTDEQKAAAKALFSNVLNYGIKAKEANAYFDAELPGEQV